MASRLKCLVQCRLRLLDCLRQPRTRKTVGSAMDDTDKPKMFRTLRGFLNGEEPDEADYSHFCASLRIHGDGVPFEEISERLGVEATHLHRKDDRLRPNSRAW